MAPTRRSARHASTGTPTSGGPSPGASLMDSVDIPSRFTLQDEADILMDRDGSLLGHDDDDDGVAGHADASSGLANVDKHVSTLPVDLQLDLGMPMAFDDDSRLASAAMHLDPSLPGTQFTATEDNSTESEDAHDGASVNDNLADLSAAEDEDDDEEAGLPDVEDFGDDMTGLHDHEIAASINKSNNAPSPATSASVPIRLSRAREEDSHPDEDDTSTGTDNQRPTKRQKRSGSRLSRSALRKRSRSSSTLSSALSDVTGLVSKGDISSVQAGLHDIDDAHDPLEDKQPDPARTDKDRRDAEELSRLRRGSPDSQFSASASDEDEDDVPLQAIVQSKVNNLGQTPNKGLSKNTSGRTAVLGSQVSGKGPGRKGQGHNRQLSGSISQGSAVRMPTNTAVDVAIAEEQAAKQPNKSLGTSRTVPELQPGTPHADLHNDVAALGPNGEPTGLLSDTELRDAIEARVKLEEDMIGLPAAMPAGPVGVDAMVRGQAVDDVEIIQDLKPRERPAQLEERLGIIRFIPVTSSKPSIITSILLTGLKNIFQRQLPKMPREYITRLVFDRNHWSMAIVKTGYQVVGGITYRPFDTRGFGEIVFCAITGTEQVRGYGSHLMNHLKDWVKLAHPNINHFLTYADNYAFGYFKKQGFTKDLTLPRSVWAGYIKDYEGATIMQCSMLPKISYLQTAHMLLKQKQLILNKIRERSSTHIIHSGRELFAGRTRVKPGEVAALRAIGWDPSMDALTRRPERGPQHAIMRRLLTDMQNHPASWAFARPVNAEEVTDYYSAIKNPMDLETMENKLNANRYQMPRTADDGRSLTPREGLELFLRDAQLIFDNCRQYNSESSNYSKNAEKLRSFLRERVKAYTEE